MRVIITLVSNYTGGHNDQITRRENSLVWTAAYK